MQGVGYYEGKAGKFQEGEGAVCVEEGVGWVVGYSVGLTVSFVC